MTVVPFRNHEDRLVAAVREYLAYLARDTNNEDWLNDPEYALLAVARVVLERICYTNFDDDDDYDGRNEEVINRIAMLTRKLDRMRCQRATPA